MARSVTLQENHPEQRFSSEKPQQEIIDDLGLLMEILPANIRQALEKESDLDNLIEIVLDLGRPPEARFYDRSIYLTDLETNREDLDSVVTRVGAFTGDNRAGIERTLHRISAIRNRKGEVVGLTCRVGRAVTGTVDIIRDFIETGDSLLLLGPPGVGKTTLLRDAARVLADELGKRVVVVDTSNEIAGDGDVPHPAIGRARRMQVPSPDLQHKIMIEAVENHMPEVIVIDEIGTEAEAIASRTIAERGVQLVATAHGQTLDNLLINPTLSDLVGGIQPVTLSDEEARRRGTQKTVLERKAPPTFDILVELKDRNVMAVYPDIGTMVDRYLAGQALQPELRRRTVEGELKIERPPLGSESPQRRGPASRPARVTARSTGRNLAIYPLGISRTRLERAIREMAAPVRIANEPIEADVILSLKSQRKRRPKKLQQALDRGAEAYTLRSNSPNQIRSFLRELVGPPGGAGGAGYGHLDSAIEEAEDAIVRIQRGMGPIELSPQNSYVRRLQHELLQDHGILSESSGSPPLRRVVAYPRESS